MVNLLFPHTHAGRQVKYPQMGISAERVFKVLGYEWAHWQQRAEMVFEQVQRGMNLKMFGFAYKDEQFVLRNISLKIPAGHTHCHGRCNGSR